MTRSVSFQHRGKSGADPSVKRLQTVHLLSERVFLLRDLPPLVSPVPAKARLCQQTGHGLCQRCGVVGWHQCAGLAVTHDLAAAAYVRRDRRQPSGHRLHECQPECLVSRQVCQHIECRHQNRYVFTGAGEDDLLAKATNFGYSTQSVDLANFAFCADEYEAETGELGDQGRCDFQQSRLPFGIKAPHHANHQCVGGDAPFLAESRTLSGGLCAVRQRVLLDIDSIVQQSDEGRRQLMLANQMITHDTGNGDHGVRYTSEQLPAQLWRFAQCPQHVRVQNKARQASLLSATGDHGPHKSRHVVTTGVDVEQIDPLVRCLIQPGDHAIVDDPTYPGAIQCLRAGGAKLIGWDTSWSLEKLEELILRFRPKLLFTTPTFHNPTGKVMRPTVRAGLLELAGRYHIPILEDDVYSRTYLDGIAPPPSLLKLDAHSQVIYISTFSKILAPGLRVGWVVAPPYMVKQLSLMKMRANLFTGGLNQLAMSEMIENGSLSRHLDRVRHLHCILRDTAAAALRPAREEGLLKFHKPEGGLFLWAQLSQQLDLDTLLARLEERGVSVAPGNAFFPNKAKATYLRICYTAAPAQQVRRGVRILVSTLRESLRGDGLLAP